MARNRKLVDSGVGWMGEIPDGWHVSRIAELAELKNGDWGSEPVVEGKGVICYRKADYSGNLILSGDTRRLSRRAPFVAKHDTIIEKSGGGESSPVGEPALVVSEELAICSNFMMRARARVGVDGLFFFYSVLAMYQSGEVYNLFKQTTGIQNLETSKFKATPLPVPSQLEQQAIASFLVHHTSLLDRERDLLGSKIEVLRGKRKALIFECVTGKRTIVETQYLAGLDDWSAVVCAGALAAIPTSDEDGSPAPGHRMTDSGVEWVGKIPLSWSMDYLKNRAKMQLGKMLTPERRGGFELLVDYFRSANVTGASSVLKKMWATPAEIWKNMVQIGDILVSEGGSIGAPFHVLDGSTLSKTTIIQNSVHRVRFHECQRYGFWWLKAMYDGEVHADAANAVSIAHLTKEKFEKTHVPVPPVEEQRAIAVFLDHSTSLIDREISLLEVQQKLLTEKRKSLIFEAVTGKFDTQTEVNG